MPIYPRQLHFGSIKHFLRLMPSLGLRDAKDIEIFMLAKNSNAILISKDADFQQLLQKLGPPPKLIWLTCGNTSNEKLRTIFSFSLRQAIEMLRKGENLIEISDALLI